MRFTLVISLLLAILAVVFALQNPGVTDVNVLGLSYQGSKALILIITFAVGVLVGVLATLPAYFRNRSKVRSLRKTIAEERSETRRQRKKGPPPSEQPTSSISSEPSSSETRSEPPPKTN